MAPGFRSWFWKLLGKWLLQASVGEGVSRGIASAVRREILSFILFLTS